MTFLNRVRVGKELRGKGTNVGGTALMGLNVY